MLGERMWSGDSFRLVENIINGELVEEGEGIDGCVLIFVFEDGGWL